MAAGSFGVFTFLDDPESVVIKSFTKSSGKSTTTPGTGHQHERDGGQLRCGNDTRRPFSRPADDGPGLDAGDEKKKVLWVFPDKLLGLMERPGAEAKDKGGH